MDFINLLPKNKQTLQKVLFLKALATKTRECHAQKGFSSDELVKEMRITSGDNAKVLNRVYKELDKDKEFFSKLQNFAKTQGLPFCPWIGKEEGGGRGKLSEYFLRAKDFSEEELVQVESSDPKTLPVKETCSITAPINTNQKSVVSYERKSLPSGKWWTHKSDEFVLKGWRWWFYLSPVLLVLLLGLLVFAQLLFGWSIFSLGSLLYLGLGLLIAISFYVFLIPPWGIKQSDFFNFLFLSFRASIFLETVPTEEKDKFGGTIRKRRWSTYSGKCAICGDSLILERKNWSSEIFEGRCISNPQQHIFSFDHTTCKGYRLETDR